MQSECPTLAHQVVFTALVAFRSCALSNGVNPVIVQSFTHHYLKEDVMSDDLTKAGAQDRARINVNEVHEVTYWTNELGVTTVSYTHLTLPTNREV